MRRWSPLLLPPLLLAAASPLSADASARPRLRELGIEPGILQPGPLNAITDVEGSADTTHSGSRPPVPWFPPAQFRPVSGRRRRLFVKLRVSFRLAILLTLAVALLSCAREKTAPRTWVGACAQLDIAELGEAEVVPQLVERVQPAIEARPRLGTVLLEVILDPSGSVCDARVVKPLEPTLDKAALEAVRQWKFTPAQRDGKPAAARYFASVEYKRPGAPEEPEDYASPAHPPTGGQGE